MLECCRSTVDNLNRECAVASWWFKWLSNISIHAISYDSFYLLSCHIVSPSHYLRVEFLMVVSLDEVLVSVAMPTLN